MSSPENKSARNSPFSGHFGHGDILTKSADAGRRRVRAARQYLARAIRQRQFAARADRDAYRHVEGVRCRFPLHACVAVRGAYLRGGARQPAAQNRLDPESLVWLSCEYVKWLRPADPL